MDEHHIMLSTRELPWAFDLTAYDKYLAGELVDYDLPQEQIDAALRELPTAG